MSGRSDVPRGGSGSLASFHSLKAWLKLRLPFSPFLVHPCIHARAQQSGAKGKGAVRKFKTSDLKDELQALHCTAASPNAQGGRAWVAYGGRAGLLRAQRLCLSVSDYS